VPRYTASGCVHLVARSLTRAQSSAQNRSVTAPTTSRHAIGPRFYHQPERPRRYRDPGHGVVARTGNGGVLQSGVHADRYGSGGWCAFRR